MTTGPSLKPVIWVGSSRKDLRRFPELVVKQRLREAEQIAKEREP